MDGYYILKYIVDGNKDLRSSFNLQTLYLKLCGRIKSTLTNYEHRNTHIQSCFTSSFRA